MRFLELFVLGALCPNLGQAIDNGLGITPPRGWRSWNLFGPAINDTVMRAQMDAVLDSSRKVNGVPTTLASLGFDWISMDDGWQKCNCSTRGSIDPSLPTCPVCKTGGCSWHTPDSEGGKPIVDLHKFPDMKAMVDHGHSLGLKVGSYMNNCVCMEGGDPPMGNHCNGETHYEQDVAFLVENGFDGVKIDNCGASHNVTHWSELMNASGRPIRTESCHTFHPNHGTPSSWPNFPVWDPATKAADAECPMNLYRTGGDVKADFSSTIGEAYAVVQYSDRPDPLSHPGCWAYPDMSEIGNFNGADPLRTDEERTHWGLWCIMSSPLILGLDMSQSDTMDRIWSTITNKDALAINNAWTGHPGTLVKSYRGTGEAVPLTVDQAPCNGQPESLGWTLLDGQLSPPPAVGARSATVCLGTDSGPEGQTTAGESSCPPPTTRFGGSGCGSVFADCKKQAGKGAWTHNTTTGVLMFQPSKAAAAAAAAQGTFKSSTGTGTTDPTKPQCLRAEPPAGVGGFYGGPKAANTAPGGCPGGKGAVANTSSFTFTSKGEIQVGTGVCLVARTLYGAQLWTKPLPGGKVAVLVVNIGEVSQAFNLPMADVPSLDCTRPCTVRDVWDQKDLPPVTTQLQMQLRSHESAFFIITAEKTI